MESNILLDLNSVEPYPLFKLHPYSDKKSLSHPDDSIRKEKQDKILPLDEKPI